MPIYEYLCEQDGTVLELLRPMRDADAPVPDPEGLGRTFIRKPSAFMAPAPGAGAPGPSPGGCCPCGKPGGGCGSLRAG